MPITSGERLTIVPNEKSEYGRPIDHVDRDASGAGRACKAFSLRIVASTDRDCGAGEILRLPVAAMERDGPVRRGGGDGEHVFREVAREHIDRRARRRQQFRLPGCGRRAAADQCALVVKLHEYRKARQRLHMR